MMTVIISVIVSILLGGFSPVISPGLNFPSQNLFSQIYSQIDKSSDNLTKTEPKEPEARKMRSWTDVDPMSNLKNVTGPLDSIWEALGGQIRSSLDDRSSSSLPEALKSSLGTNISDKDISNVSQGLKIARTAFILIANIFITVLEIVLWLLKGILKMVG